MKIKFKEIKLPELQKKYILKNRNFLNSQNYILGKNEKKKIMSKFFLEIFLNLKNKFSFFNKVKFKIGNFLDHYSGSTPLTIKGVFYTLFIMIFSVLILYFTLGINFFLSYPIFSFVLYLSILGFFLFVNIYTLILIPIYMISLILLIIYLFFNIYLLNRIKGFQIIKYLPKSKILEKFIFSSKNYAENKYYRIELK